MVTLLLDRKESTKLVAFSLHIRSYIMDIFDHVLFCYFKKTPLLICLQNNYFLPFEQEMEKI